MVADHAVTDENMCAGMADRTGTYVAWCGARVVPPSMCEPSCGRVGVVWRCCASIVWGADSCVGGAAVSESDLNTRLAVFVAWCPMGRLTTSRSGCRPAVSLLASWSRSRIR